MNTDDRIVSALDRATIESEIKTADLIWIGDIGIADSLRRWHWERSILDADDLLSRYHRSRLTCLSGMRRARAAWQSAIWRRRETSFLKRFDRVVVCSEDDRNYLGSDERLRVIPNTFDTQAIRIARTPTGIPRFGFVGTLEYEPNRDAVRWFGRNIMPGILRALPAAEFRVIGKGSAELFRAEGLPGTALGYLEDTTEEIASWTAMVVPVRFGGGTRVKIAEAFARRIPVVSTAVGAFGYDVAHGRELLLADPPSDFVQACVSIAKDHSLAERLVESGADCLRRHYSADSVRERVRDLAREVIATNSGETRAQSAACLAGMPRGVGIPGAH